MDLVKVHEGHVKVLEGELAACKAAALQASQQEAALLRQQEVLALQAKSLTAKIEEAQNVLKQKDKEVAEMHTQVCISSPLLSSPK